MWSHALSVLRCPSCKGGLQLHTLDVEAAPSGDSGNSGSKWIERGALECGACSVVYPVDSGVPVMLTYETRIATRAGYSSA